MPVVTAHGTASLKHGRCSGPPTFGGGQIRTTFRAGTTDEVLEAPQEAV